MPPTEYGLSTWDENDPKLGGNDFKRYSSITVLAKRDDDCIYSLPNELICQELGRAIGLPVPVGVVGERESVSYYASLMFNMAGQILPPADAKRFVDEQPELAFGITMFDIWVGNEDRHAKNIHYDTSSRRTQIFDHSQCLMHFQGKFTLERKADILALGGSQNCLLPHLSSLNSCWDWYSRITSLPDYFIRDKVEETVRWGMPTGDAVCCVDFLLTRRHKLLQLIRSNRSEFVLASNAISNIAAFDTQESDYII